MFFRRIIRKNSDKHEGWVANSWAFDIAVNVWI